MVPNTKMLMIGIHISHPPSCHDATLGGMGNGRICWGWSWRRLWAKARGSVLPWYQGCNSMINQINLIYMPPYAQYTISPVRLLGTPGGRRRHWHRPPGCALPYAICFHSWFIASIDQWEHQDWQPLIDWSFLCPAGNIAPANAVEVQQCHQNITGRYIYYNTWIHETNNHL